MDNNSYNLSDFHFFVPLKKHLAGKRFPPDADMRQTLSSRVPKIDTDFFYAMMKGLVPRCKKCVMSLVAQCRSDVYHQLQMFTKGRIILAITTISYFN
jgi:hypothetical protein